MDENGKSKCKAFIAKDFQSLNGMPLSRFLFLLRSDHADTVAREATTIQSLKYYSLNPSYFPFNTAVGSQDGYEEYDQNLFRPIFDEMQKKNSILKFSPLFWFDFIIIHFYCIFFLMCSFLVTHRSLCKQYEIDTET
jgi:hypothetical protein